MVLSLLRDRGPLSRAQLAAITGLSPTTITKAVAPLVQRGLLVESVQASGSIGRPSIMLTPRPESVTAVGVQVGATTVRAGVADAVGRVRHTVSASFDLTSRPEAVADLVAQTVAPLLPGAGTCIGIGVGATGPVDLERRDLLISIHHGWRDVPLADLLEARLGLPVVVDHNVRCMALGELRYGGWDVDSLAYLYVKTGVGLGVAVRGEPFYGGSGGESYLGHTRVEEDGAPCTCGARGCLETLVSEPSMVQALREVLPRGRPAGPAGGVLTVLHAEVERGNAAAADLQERFVDLLSGALATVTNLFTPGLVLVGGILSDAPATLVEQLGRRTRERIFPLLREEFRLLPGDGSDAAAVGGAAATALEVLHYG